MELRVVYSWFPSQLSNTFVWWYLVGSPQAAALTAWIWRLLQLAATCVFWSGKTLNKCEVPLITRNPRHFTLVASPNRSFKKDISETIDHSAGEDNRIDNTRARHGITPPSLGNTPLMQQSIMNVCKITSLGRFSITPIQARTRRKGLFLKLVKYRQRVLFDLFLFVRRKT